jgi:hypothetical protein
MAATTDLADRGWRSLVDKAAERAGSGTAADTGTSIHTASEMLDYGQDVSGIPADILDDAKAYRVACEAAGLEPVAAEVFVANERLAVAGSFDRLVKCPDGKFRILDIKTVGTNKSPELAAKYSARAWSIQVSVYAGSRPYCAEQGYKDWTEVGLGQPETSGFNAIIAVIPRGSGTCSLLAVDLDAGAEMADLAVQVRKARKQSPARGWDIEKG